MPTLKELLRIKVKQTGNMLKKEVKKEPARNNKVFKALIKPKD